MKSIKKFKTITEISNSLKLPQHVLRFWESKFKQLKPLKLSGNRRYYREIDVELIGYIKNLLHEDCISIRGVQKIFANQGSEIGRPSKIISEIIVNDGLITNLKIGGTALLSYFGSVKYP